MYRQELRTRGIDVDLESCLEEHPQGFSIDDIETVLAVYEGQPDGEDWRWIIRLKDGRYVYLRGGCDYTGWGCQSWAEAFYGNSPREVMTISLEKYDPAVESLERQLYFGVKDKTSDEAIGLPADF